MRKRKGITFLMMTVFSLSGCLLWGLPEFKEKPLVKIEESKREIRVINLLNGLDLTRDQMGMILKCAK
jgi:hypothetical protein